MKFNSYDKEAAKQAFYTLLALGCFLTSTVVIGEYFGINAVFAFMFLAILATCGYIAFVAKEK
jgi:hypothetical protein